MKKFLLLIFLIGAMNFAQAEDAFKKFFKDELDLQFGAGFNINTASLVGIYYNVMLYQADKQNALVNLPGLSATEVAAYKTYSETVKTAVLVSNICASLEYGLKFRLLWHMLIAEADLSFLPMEGAYNGKFDFSMNINAGVRFPWWIMPYIMVGTLFTFSFYPDDFIKVESWKSNWGGFRNFLFRPGFNLKVGLDFKFKTFSIGGYYQYQIKDFDEFTTFFDKIIVGNIGDSDEEIAEAVGMVFGKQSKFGIVLTIYPQGFFKKK